MEDPICPVYSEVGLNTHEQRKFELEYFGASGERIAFERRIPNMRVHCRAEAATGVMASEGSMSEMQ